MRLDRDGKYQRPRVVDETATLSYYPATVRQLVVTGLSRDAATVIITNDPRRRGSDPRRRPEL